MGRSDKQGRLPIQQAVDRFRADVVAEVRVLNEHLPRSGRLERREIDRLVDDLLFAILETSRRRNASLLDRVVWMAGGVLVDAIRRRRRPAKAGAAVVHWGPRAVPQGGGLRGDGGEAAVPQAGEPFEAPDDAIAAGDGSRVAGGRP